MISHSKTISLVTILEVNSYTCRYELRLIFNHEHTHIYKRKRKRQNHKDKLPNIELEISQAVPNRIGYILFTVCNFGSLYICLSRHVIESDV